MSAQDIQKILDYPAKKDFKVDFVSTTVEVKPVEVKTATPVEVKVETPVETPVEVDVSTKI